MQSKNKNLSNRIKMSIGLDFREVIFISLVFLYIHSYKRYFICLKNQHPIYLNYEKELDN